MRKGDTVKVRSSAKYTGQNMDWTEILTGVEVLTEDLKVYHCSDTKLTAFVPKTTCFFDSKDLMEGFVYEYVIPAGSKIEKFCSEVRVALTTDDELRYLGTVEFVKTGKWTKDHTPEYKRIDRTVK